MNKRLARKKRSIWVRLAERTDDWWKKMLSEDVSEQCWKKNFRMGKDAFDELVAILDPYIGPKTSPNYRRLSSTKKVAMVLYYLKDTGSLWMTANAFGVHQSTVSKTLKTVCEAINEILGPRLVQLPQSEEEMREKISGFEMLFGMVQVFGCIDGTHIPIKRPFSASQDYFNYKQFFSLNVQAICDSRGNFMDVECKWPGSVHDAKVFANSYVCQGLQNKRINQTNFNLLPGYDSVPSYLIGDPAYPLTSFCMKEFQSCTENKPVVFNNLLRGARNQIESAFGRLKARWRIITRPIDLKLDIVPSVIYSCFVLHNYCQTKSSCALGVDEVKLYTENHKRDEVNEPPDPIYSSNTNEGEVFREILVEYISQNLVT